MNLNNNIHSDSDDNFIGQSTKQSSDDCDYDNNNNIITEFVTLEYNKTNDNDDIIEPYIEIKASYNNNNNTNDDSGNESDDESSDIEEEPIVINNNNRRTILLKLSPFIITSVIATALLFRRNP